MLMKQEIRWTPQIHVAGNPIFLIIMRVCVCVCVCV